MIRVGNTATGAAPVEAAWIGSGDAGIGIAAGTDAAAGTNCGADCTVARALDYRMSRPSQTLLADVTSSAVALPLAVVSRSPVDLGWT